MPEIQQIGPANVANVYCQMAKVHIARLRPMGQWRTHRASRALFRRVGHLPVWTRSTLSSSCLALSTSAAGMPFFLHTPGYVSIPLFEITAVCADRPDCVRALFTLLSACADRNTSSHRAWHIRIHAAAPHARPRPRDGTHPPGHAPQYSAPAPHNLRVALRRAFTKPFGRYEQPRVMGAPRTTVLTCRCAILRTVWRATVGSRHDDHEHMCLIAGPPWLSRKRCPTPSPAPAPATSAYALPASPPYTKGRPVTLFMVFPGRTAVSTLLSVASHPQKLYP